MKKPREDGYRDFTTKELKWLKAFESIMKKAPDSLFLFVGSGITVFTTDENKNRYMTMSSGGESVDGNATCSGIITKMQYDGGDY